MIVYFRQNGPILSVLGSCIFSLDRVLDVWPFSASANVPSITRSGQADDHFRVDLWKILKIDIEKDDQYARINFLKINF